MIGKIEIIEVDIQTSAIVEAKVLTCILQQKRSLTHTSATLNTDEAMRPIYFAHQLTSDRIAQVLYKIAMCSIKRFHYTIPQILGKFFANIVII